MECSASQTTLLVQYVIVRLERRRFLRPSNLFLAFDSGIFRWQLYNKRELVVWKYREESC